MFPALLVPALRFLTVRRQIGTDEIMSMAHGWGSFEPVPLKLPSYSDEQLSNVNFLLAGVGDGA